MQKYFITCLLSDNKITTYTDDITELKKNLKQLNLLLPKIILKK